MCSFRDRRRRARRARRDGLQPVAVFTDDGRLPPTAAQVIARAAWRYRSELAPVGAAAVVFLAGWWAHHNTPAWYPYFIVGSAIATWVLVAFGEALGLQRPATRVFAAATVFAAGGWVAFAALLGPLTPPLLLALAAATLTLAVPWWADGRRRDRARVQRALGAWPAIARAVGLPGSVIVASSVEGHVWRAWLRLANGQTVFDVAARIPAIESLLGTRQGAVTVYPSHDGRANWCELHGLGTDLHVARIS